MDRTFLISDKALFCNKQMPPLSNLSEIKRENLTYFYSAYSPLVVVISKINYLVENPYKNRV